MPSPRSTSLVVDGEIAERIRAFDWSRTSVGPLADWPTALVTTAGVVIENSFPQVLLWGPELVVCAYNEAYRPLLGAKPDPLGRRFLEVWPEVRDAIEPLLRDALRGGSTLFHDAAFLLRRSGAAEEAFFDFAFSPVRVDSGEIGGVLNTAVETTHWVVEQRALEASEKRFRALLTASADVVFHVSPDWSEMRALDRRGFLEDVKRPTKEWLDEYVEPQDQRPVLEAIQEATRSRSMFELEHRVRRKDGTPGWMLSRAIPVIDGNGEITEWFGAATEMTARRSSEEALRRSEAILNAILDTLPAGVVIADTRGRIVRDNAATRELWGVPPEADSWEGYSDRVGWCSESGEGIQAHEWAMARALLHGEVTRNQLVRSRRFGSNEQRCYLNNVAPLRDAGGEIIGGVAAMLDVTDRFAAESAVRESDRAKDEFLAVLGHELRNPLAPLRTGLDLLPAAAKDPAMLDDLQAMMDRQLSHLVRLVDDLLDISRISRGRIELRRTALDLNAPVRAAVEQMCSVIEERRHELVVELSDAPLRIDGDCERLTQVVANLLSNAARYMEPGGRILVTSAAEDGQAAVRVRDTGYGIPPERVRDLFKLFSQIAEHRAATGGGGLGIGLALSRRLVEMHGGEVTAWSEGLGQGSEFVVRLPLSGAGAEATVARRPQAAPGRARRVLVVDDNVDAAESLRMLLAIRGHDAQAVHDGPAALAHAEQCAPDVLLLDLGLPEMDGIEVARRIRAMPGGARILLVAVTGWSQEEDRERTRRAGFDAHLAKPIDSEALLAVIDRRG